MNKQDAHVFIIENNEYQNPLGSSRVEFDIKLDLDSEKIFYDIDNYKDELREDILYFSQGFELKDDNIIYIWAKTEYLGSLLDDIYKANGYVLNKKYGEN